MKAKILIPIILCLAMTPAINAEKQTTQTPSHNKNKTSNIRLINKGNSPRGETDGEIELEVRDGLLFITFEQPEGNATITMSEMGCNTFYHDHANTAAPIIVPASDRNMPVQITITTADNNQYEGWILSNHE